MTFLKNSFNAGELGDLLRYRIDLSKYASGVAAPLENFWVLPYGGIENRPGTEFVRACYDETHPVRILPFRFSASGQPGKITPLQRKFKAVKQADACIFRLIPEWQLHKDEVEKAIRAADTAAHKEVQEYRLYPRIIGQTMRKAFVAYEINRRISNKITLQSFFNTVTGKEEKGSSFDIMISLVGNPKLSVIHGVTAKYNYPEKRIIMSFK